MATWIWKEREKSGDFSLNPDSIMLKYVAGRHGDESYIGAYAIAATPFIYQNLFRQKIVAKSLGGGMWNVDIPYGHTAPPDVNSYGISYDTTGGTAHVTQAKEHIEDYGPAGQDPPDHQGALNVQEDGRPEGVDIVVPAFRWTERHTLSIAVAGWPYSQILKALTGKVNGFAFRGFPLGQVLFEGATADYSSAAGISQEIQINYNFAQNDNITNITYDTVMNVTKIGWELLWFEHQRKADSVANKMISPLLAVHRERVYDAADFGLMGIGN